jgi:hypothetical protein
MVTLCTLCGRAAGGRVDQVVVALAVCFEVALVVARGGDRGVFQRQHGHHLARAAGVADGHAPGPAAAVADGAAVASGADHGVGDATALQQRRGAVHRMALGEAAQVDAHAVQPEAQRAGVRVQVQVLPADAFARRLQRGRIRAHPGPVVVQPAHRGVTDVKGTAGQTRKGHGLLDQPEHLVGQRYALARGVRLMRLSSLAGLCGLMQRSMRCISSTTAVAASSPSRRSSAHSSTRMAVPMMASSRTTQHALEQVRVAAADFSSFSPWPLTLTIWRPRKSRVMPAMAFTLTSVLRWICQNSCGSSSSTSSLMGLRISASMLAVCTRVYFSSLMKNSTSATGIIWIAWPTLAWIHSR